MAKAGTAAPEDPPVARTLIVATIKLNSALRLRTGADETARTAPDAKRPGTIGEDVGVGAIAIDVQGRPILTATALKGVLRDRLVRRIAAGRAGGIKAADVDIVFGKYPEEDKVNDRKLQLPYGGIAEFRDATLTTASTTLIAGSTAIDRKTGAAAAGLLRHGREVAPGAEFEFSIILDRATDEQVSVIIEALQGAGEIALGGHTGSGSGVAEIGTIRQATLDKAAIAEWIKEPEPLDWLAFARKRLQDVAAPAAGATGAGPVDYLTFKLRLTFDGPFLVSKDVFKALGDKSEDPNRIPLTVDGADGDKKWLLPGSSLRGALRAQAERIHQTVHGSAGGPKEQLSHVVALFGATDWRGAVTIGDFLSVKEVVAREQEMVAIDRFTGGASVHRKFKLEALHHAVFEGTITLELNRPKQYLSGGGKRRASGGEQEATPRELGPADLGLAALVIRDLCEGDIALGYGRTKGFGACTVELLAWSGQGSAKIGGLEFSKEAAWLDEAKAGSFEEPTRAHLDAAVADYRPPKKPAEEKNHD